MAKNGCQCFNIIYDDLSTKKPLGALRVHDSDRNCDSGHRMGYWNVPPPLGTKVVEEVNPRAAKNTPRTLEKKPRKKQTNRQKTPTKRRKT